MIEEDLIQLGAKFNDIGDKAEVRINGMILRFEINILNYESADEYTADPIYGWDFVELISIENDKKRADAQRRRKILLEIWRNLGPIQVPFFKGHAVIEEREYVFLFRKEKEDVCSLTAYEKEGGSYKKVGTLIRCGIGKKGYTTFSKECEW